jgi:hypothetical protein
MENLTKKNVRKDGKISELNSIIDTKSAKIQTLILDLNSIKSCQT